MLLWLIDRAGFRFAFMGKPHTPVINILAVVYFEYLVKAIKTLPGSPRKRGQGRVGTPKVAGERVGAGE